MYCDILHTITVLINMSLNLYVSCPAPSGIKHTKSNEK